MRVAERSHSALVAVLFAVVLISLPASVAATNDTANEDEFEGLPAGEGREETYYACQACHSIKLVLQQGMNRERWSETLDWMVEEQEMEPMEGDERKLILDYLVTYLGENRTKRN